MSVVFGRSPLSLDIEPYLAAVRKFNQLVSELAGKLEQISEARDEALKVSAELQRELGTTDQKLQDIAGAVRQQITMEFTRKAARSDGGVEPVAVRRVS
jgi:phage-related tail protein